MNSLADNDARTRALDTRHSFIVQAPAGSGKTSLLTLRFLSLLATVNNPEKIIAITFTKKAASEMKERIISALCLANGDKPSESYLLHQYELAIKVLAHDKKHQWNLLKNPSRLRIQTIDSFCFFLTSKMPKHAEGIGFSQVDDDPISMYQIASRNCLKDYMNSTESNAADSLLRYFANNERRLQELLAAFLPFRDQWLPLVLNPDHREEQTFNDTANEIKKHIVKIVSAELSRELLDKLNIIAQYRSQFINDKLVDINYQQLSFFDVSKISNLLLSKQNNWRKRFTVKEGFPAISSFKRKEEKESAKFIKETLNDLLSHLINNEKLLCHLQMAKLLPNSPYTSQDLVYTQNLFNLLPRLVAHLKLIFTQHAKVDFTEVSMMASYALGDDEPTALDLYLDYNIEHLLIDEFQDTSINQFELIQKVTQHWEKDDHKTLFIVGDPMQSIYRFRQADVGVFLNAKIHGIGEKQLIPLYLSVNFRSQAPIIDWINRVCSDIFPKEDDAYFGSVCFHHSQSIKDGEAHINAFSFNDEMEQAASVLNIIQQNPTKDIAILVSTRNQLKAITPFLRENGININGVDLEKLSNTVIVNTLLQLTCCILYPYKKQYILALLQSPLCGINYEELYAISQCIGDNHFKCLTKHLTALNLTDESKQRVNYLIEILTHYASWCYREPIHYIVQSCFNALNGPALIGNNRNNIELFFSVLDQFIGYPIDVDLLKHKVLKLYSEEKSNSQVTLMTIHKSKGLEFDIVILPSLQATSGKSQQKLFKNIEVLDEHNHRHLLISPIKSSYDEENPLYNFIEFIEKHKNQNEKKRLLYVALTRAKEAIYLMSHSCDINKASKQSFVSLLKPHVTFTTDECIVSKAEKPLLSYRLKQKYFGAVKLDPINTAYRTEIQKHYNKDSIIGTFIHLVLLEIANKHIQTFEDINTSIWKAQLRALNLRNRDISFAMEKAKIAIKNMFDCPVGQWILSPHKDEHNEYPLSTHSRSYTIDRLFVDANYLWIIDYKTSKFKQSQMTPYIEQLEGYAELCARLKKISINNIKLGLYFPLSKTFASWDATCIDTTYSVNEPTLAE